jgi:serine phosphatase RsbU (regulator of sigma subunit)
VSTHSTDQSGQLALEFIGDLYKDPFVLRADRPISIGRAADSDIVLLAETVSRRHAMVAERGGRAMLSDLGSTHGTFLNSLRLPASKLTPVAPGDLIQIGPFTLRVIVTSDRTHAHVSTAMLQEEPTSFEVQALSAVSPHAGRRLRALTEAIARLDAARSVEEAAQISLRTALSGSGYARAAILRRTQDMEVEIVASSRANPADQSPFSFSRSLILAAGAGQTAVLSPTLKRVTSQSLVGLNIHSALCAPIRVGDAVAAYLYLDARESESAVDPEGAGFCDAMAVAIGLALANISRAELERRQGALTAELAAAREAQLFILPEPDATREFLSYGMRMHAGAYVAGDLFDVVPLGDGRTAIVIGDVAGHGAGSAMLMASTQSYLNAQLRMLRDPALALAAANAYLAGKPMAGKFVSLWLGVFSPDGELEFVDAGHGHWIHLPAGGRANLGRHAPGSIPLGISPDTVFAATRVRLGQGDRILLYTDGVIEQKNLRGEMFGLDSLTPLLSATRTPAEQASHVLEQVVRHSGDGTLEDDATVACVQFGCAD